MRPLLRGLWLPVALGSLWWGCDDATAPGPADAGIAAVSVDPAAQRFVLHHGAVQGPDGQILRIDLVGSNLQVDAPRRRVSLDVALHHAGALPVYGPAHVWVGCFVPATVTVVNADGISRRPGCRPWSFDYSGSLGDDFTLAPGETSQAKSWIFQVPHVASFAFSCEFELSFQPGIPPVVLTDLQPGQIPQDPYGLESIHLQGSILRLDVGISGCSPEHPLVLYAGRSFMESWPVQTWLLLAHDDGDEPCDAAFQRTLHFDLDPIRQEHIRVYGGPGTVRLNFRDFQGNPHVLHLEP